jgi:hypothetical protein
MTPKGRAVAAAAALPLVLGATAACGTDVHLKGPAQTVTVRAPAAFTVKGKKLRLSAVTHGGATIGAGDTTRTVRQGDAFTVDDVRFTVDKIDDATHRVTLTGTVEITLP